MIPFIDDSPRLDFESAVNESVYMAVVMDLEDDNDRLGEAWEIYRDRQAHRFTEWRHCYNQRCCGDPRLQEFIDLVNDVLTYDSIVACYLCSLPKWDEDTCQDDSYYHRTVCDSCREDIPSCDRCNEWTAGGHDDLTSIEGDDYYCSSCRDNYCSWCEHCDVYYHDDSDDHAHDVQCDCSPQSLHFQMLANSHGVIHQDERLQVELPKGYISDRAIAEVAQMLWSGQIAQLWQEGNGSNLNHSWGAVHRVVNNLDRMWQTKEGNFTKRLSKALYQQLQIKLDAGLLSRVGSEVRRHAGDSTNSWYIEVTRNLNQSAEAFYHEGSCWWGSEHRSLCALKHWGGFALRTYYNEKDFSDCPTGRAWVQPLGKDMQPTTDIHGAHAFVVYNGYGELEGYTAARLVAYLTSRTYKKISFTASHQYVNSGGYLIADQETCDQTEGVHIDGLSYHEKVHEAAAA